MNNKMNQLFTLIELKRLYPDAKSIELDVNQNCYWVETILVSDGVKGSKVIRSTYRSDDLLPKAIIECILKSKGIYHDSI